MSARTTPETDDWPSEANRRRTFRELFEAERQRDEAVELLREFISGPVSYQMDVAARAFLARLEKEKSC